MLNFVEEDVVHPVRLHVGCDVLVESVILLQILEGQVFKVDGNDISLTNALFEQILPEQLEQDRFAAAAKAGDNLDDVFVTVTLQKFQILISCYSFHDIYSKQNQLVFKRYYIMNLDFIPII